MGLWDNVKKTIAANLPDVVTNSDISGQSGEMIWKYENSGLISGSRLIVGESQEAIFVKGGVIEHIFGAGTYDLQTSNIPILKQLLNMAYGGGNANAAEVWFVNKASIMEIGWGTPSPLTMEDHKFDFPITLNVRCNGAISVKVTDSERMFKELAGQGKSFTVDHFKQSIRGMLISKLRTAIGNYMQKSKLGFVQLQNSITVLEDPIMMAVTADLEKYGLAATACYVKGFSVVDDDSWRNYKRYEDQIISRTLDTKLQANKTQTLGQLDITLEQSKMQALGYDYTTQRKFDVMESAASNQGNPAMQAPVSLGIGFGVGNAVAKNMDQFTDVMQPVQPTAQTVAPSAPQSGAVSCPKCHAPTMQGAKFCPECGFVLQRMCYGCKTVLPQETKFCLECGKKILLCASCGKDNPVDASACVHCQASFQVSIACPNCATIMKAGAKFCPECGTKNPL